LIRSCQGIITKPWRRTLEASCFPPMQVHHQYWEGSLHSQYLQGWAHRLQ
jgi:hypothetical protein